MHKGRHMYVYKYGKWKEAKRESNAVPFGAITL